MSDVNDVDDYGLPAGILGRHPDPFYGAIGRVVCVCAVLEDKVTTLRHTLARAQQGQYSQQPIRQQINVARSLSRNLPDQAEQTITAFLDAVEDAFHRRNDLVHSSFPAQPDGRLWGHRPTRDKNTTDGSADSVETSIEELRGLVQQLAELVQRFNEVHAIAITRRSDST